MSVKVYIPKDSAALSMGANRVAKAIALEASKRNVEIQIVRNGSRGMLYLETLVEVETNAGRVAYGPIRQKDVSDLFDADFLSGAQTHPLSLGLTEDIAYFKNQQRLTFARIGITDPTDLDEYIAHDGYKGLSNALQMSGAEIVQAVTDSGLRGRGGAAFPTGIKWKTVLDCTGEQKYVVL